MVRNARSIAIHDAVQLIAENLRLGIGSVGYVFKDGAGKFKGALALEQHVTLWLIIGMKDNNRLDFIRM